VRPDVDDVLHGIGRHERRVASAAPAPRVVTVDQLERDLSPM